METTPFNAKLEIAPTRLSLLKAANLIILLISFAVNMMAVLLPLNGKTPKELSDQYPNLFTPAGLTFSIWSLIYLLLLLFIGWQYWPIRSAQRRLDRDQAIDALGGQFVMVSLLNMSWLFSWHYEYVALSFLIMLTMLFQLIRINRLAFYNLPHTRNFRNFLQLPFGLYLGWISVASIANATVLLTSVQWNGFGLSAELWTGVMMTTAVALSMGMVFVRRNIPYALAVAWALWGIALKHRELFNTSMSTIIAIAYAGIAIVLITTIVKFIPWWGQAVGDSSLASSSTVAKKS